MPKKLVSLMLAITLLTACLFTASAAVLTKKERYDSAVAELTAYLNDEYDVDLNAVYTTFAGLGAYEHSVSFMLYIKVLIGIESGDYSYVKSSVAMIRRNPGFEEYLAENEVFGSIDALENYANGRKAELNGDSEEAMLCYEKAEGFADSYMRLTEIQSAIYEEQYEKAYTAYMTDTYEGYAEAAELFRPLTEYEYKDSVELLAAAEIMMEVLKPCEHEWEEATCLQARTCKLCGDTDGEVGEHDWQEATCEAAKTCRICKQTEGSKKDHDWKSATCTAPMTCKLCNATTGSALGHDWKKATCQAPMTCRRCSATTGSVAGHDWQEATTKKPETCAVCGLTRGNALIAVGSIITFGAYEQDNNTGNGKEPIEWQVLEIKNGKALLISKYGLDAKPYNESYTDVTWATCTLRSWLNRDFMNAAFTGEEQRRIALTNVDNSKSQGYSGWSTNGGSNTQDRIFLLSYAEANRYFGVTRDNADNAEARVSPTAYAKSRRAYEGGHEYRTADGKYAGWWWLRSPGYYQYNVSYVYASGSLAHYSVNNSTTCVRPALWLNLES